jgi:hypothetical protein
MKDAHSIRWLCQLWGVAPREALNKAAFSNFGCYRSGCGDFLPKRAAGISGSQVSTGRAGVGFHLFDPS